MIEELSELFRQRIRDCSDRIERLRASAWLITALQESGLSRNAFAEQRLDRCRPKTNLIYQWWQGRHLPRKKSVLRASTGLSVALGVYTHPIFVLLNPSTLSKQAIQRLLDPYQTRDPRRFWRFPNDAELEGACRCRSHYLEGDPYILRVRGDLWGFTALLGCTRLAHQQGKSLIAISNAEEMLRALPSAIASTDWLLRDFGLVKSCVETLLSLMTSLEMISVDWKLIERQIEAYRRAPSLLTSHPADPKPRCLLRDPVLHAEMPRRLRERKGSQQYFSMVRQTNLSEQYRESAQLSIKERLIPIQERVREAMGKKDG